MRKIHFYKQTIESRSKSAKSSYENNPKQSQNLAEKQFSQNTAFITLCISSDKSPCFCSLHKKDFSIFCFECSKFDCLDCGVLYHKSHKIAALGPLEPFFLEQIQENLKRIKESSIELSSFIENNNKTLKNLQQRKLSLIGNIRNFFRNIREMANLGEREFLKSLESNFERVYSQILEKAKNLSFLKAQISEFKQEYCGFKILNHEIPKISNKITNFFQGFQSVQGQEISQKTIDCFELFDLERNLKIIADRNFYFKGYDNLLKEINGKFSEIEKNNDKSNRPAFFRKKFKLKGNTQMKALNFSKEYAGSLQEISENNSIQTVFNSQIKKYFYQSEILKNKFLQNVDFNDIWPTSIKSANLLYQITTNEVSSEKMHQKCDGFGPYIVLIHCNKFYCFGFFCPFSFKKKEFYENNEHIFIFSLANRNGCKPKKFPVKSDKKHSSFHQSLISPCLGYAKEGLADLMIE